MPQTSPPIVIGAPEAVRRPGTLRVTARVDGREAWLESSDEPLLPRSEAFASAFLLPAAADGRDLVVEAPLDPAWLANADRLLAIYRGWWGYAPIRVIGQGSGAPGEPRGDGRSLLFSGGIDSFFTLRRHPGRIDRLLFVHGLEFHEDQESRMAAWRPALEEVAAAHGASLTVVRTNLASFDTFRRRFAQQASGGVFGAVAQAQSASDRVVISASALRCQVRPWGSTPVTDPLFGDDRLNIEHFGLDHSRLEKVREVAADPLARRHLRVCMQRAEESLHCGRCETCLRMAVTLLSLGVQDRFPTIPAGGDLSSLVGRLPPLHEVLLFYWREIDTAPLEPSLRRAVRSLLARSARRLDPLASRLRGVEQALRRSIPPSLRRVLRHLGGRGEPS